MGSIANARILPRLRCAERLITFSQAGMVLGCLLLTQLSGQTPPAQLPYFSQGIGGCMAFRFFCNLSRLS